MNILLLIILIFLIGILIFIEFKIFNQKKNVKNKNFKDINENKIKKNNKKNVFVHSKIALHSYNNHCTISRCRR